MCTLHGPDARLGYLQRSNTEQWTRGDNVLSCQLGDLGSVSGAVVEDIHLEGTQERENSLLHTQEQMGRQENYHITGRPSENKVMPHSTPLTLNWLSENYEFAEGVCIPRNVIYKHYCDFCQKNAMIPVNPASFGKIIRQKFKMVKNRRLGTRGYSTYHYYGIGIRPFSVYYEEQYSRNGLNTSIQGKRGNNQQVYSGPTPTKGQLPSTSVPVLEFPNLQDVPLPANVPHQLFRSFFTMYQAHCLRVFSFICRNELDEVQEFLSHFWKGVPLHLVGILETNAVVNMVGVCDSVLYRSIASIFVPSTRKTSTVLVAMLKKLIPLLDGWFYTMLGTLPPNLCNVKRNMAHHFCRVLRRLISLNQIWISVALLLQNKDSISKMLIDWRGTNVEQICSEVTFGSSWPETRHIMFSLFKEFEYLLEGQVGLDVLIQWFETVVDRCVTSSARERSCPVKRVARHFLLIWVTVGTRVLRDLTLTSTHSFGSFHMLSLLANDYLAHSVELLELEERSTEMMRNISAESNVNTTNPVPQGMACATMTSQQFLQHHDEAVIATSYQASLNGGSKSSHDYIYLPSQHQTGCGVKNTPHGYIAQDTHTNDCRYGSVRRCEYTDTIPPSVICTTSSCAYQGYQQYTSCHSNKSASLPPT